MLTFFIVAAALLLVLRFLPVRRSTLNEGVFNHTEEGFGMYGGRFQCFFFDRYCRKCLDEPRLRGDLVGCHVAVRSTAHMLESHWPKKGDSIKVVGWKNVFGRELMYRIVQTNFATETGARQMREYEEEMAAHRDAFERNHAMREGITIEEYRRRSAIRSERFAKTWDRLNREGAFRAAIDLSNIKVGCLEQLDFWEYAETGALPDPDEAEHLKECEECAAHLRKGRERYLAAQPNLICFSDEDLATVERTGKPPSNHLRHTKSCFRCYVRFENRHKRHLTGKPGPECLTKDDLHIIHSTGEVPEQRREHLGNCERCANTAERHRIAYIDATIPVPPYPKRRLESLKEKQAQTAEQYGD